MPMSDALKVIVAKSPAAAPEAVATLRAIHARSSIVSLRYNRTVEAALADPKATFTPDERALLAEFVATDPDDAPRTRTLPAVRVTEDEYERIVRNAEGDGVSISEYVRVRVLGAVE